MVAVLSAGALVGWLTPAHAASKNPAPPGVAERHHDVLIWVANDDDRSLIERIRGQVSDLPVTIVPMESGDPASSERVAPPATRALAFVWFSRPQAGVETIAIHVMATDRTRTVVRQVGDGSASQNGLLASATLEAAALVVRESLRDLAAESTASPASPAPAEAAPVAAPKAKAPVRSASPEPRRARLAFHARAGWELVFDGVSPGRRQGPAMLLGVQAQGLELAAFSSTSLDMTEENVHGEIGLRRHAFGIRGARATFAPTKAWRFAFALRAGAALYVRKAGKLAANVRANPDHTSVSMLLGSELALDWAPKHGPIAVFLAVGLDWLPAAPRIGYVVAGQFEPAFVVSRLQPTMQLGVAFLGERVP